MVNDLTPLALEGEELRVRQILANLVTPSLDLETQLIDSSHDPGKGYLAIVVNRSPRAPHAVVKNGDLRYWIREGPGKRLMSESEVADRYRERFSSATDRLDKLQAVHSSVLRLIAPDTDKAWLVLGAVPQVPGQGQITRQEVEAIQSWISEVRTLAPWPRSLDPLTRYTTTGYRRFIVGDVGLQNKRSARWAAAELHIDGSAGVAFAIGHNWSTGHIEPDTGELTIGDESLSFMTMAALLVVAGHASRLHSSGDLNVVASFHSLQSVSMGHSRGDFGRGELGDRSLSEFERLTHTLSLRDLVAPGPGLVAASYFVASDLVSGFGTPEVLQMSPSGELRWPYISHNSRGEVGRWADEYHVEVVGRG